MTKEDIKTKNIFNNILLYSVMILYFVLLFALLFQKKRVGSFQSINLVPFRTIAEFMFSDDIILRSFALSNILGNIVIFVPLGIYITLMNRNKSVIVNTFIIALLSTLAEVLQFIFKVGASDIDDVMLNTLGGFVGVISFCLIYKIFKSKTKSAIAIMAPIGAILAFAVLIFVNQ